MKIVFVLENYYQHLGGAEVLFKNLCEGLAEKHNVTVVTHRLPNTLEEEYINKVRIVRVNVPRKASRYFFTFFCIPTLLRHCKDADVIHTTTYNGAPPAWLIGKLYRKPKVITILEVIGDRWCKLLNMSWVSGKLHQFLEKRIVNLKFDKYVCISKATESDLVQANFNADSTFIYPGVDYKHWNPNKYSKIKIKKKLGLKNKFVYLFYGRPGPSKRFTHLLKAVSIIKKKLPNSMLFTILSKDQQYDKYHYEIQDIMMNEELCNYVQVLQPVSYKELPNYIKMADCVIVPSVTEGFGYTTVEACAMGIPVVASNVGSIPEVISGRYILVPSKDSNAIAQGVIDIFEGKGFEVTGRKFLWSDCIKEYEKVYKEVCKK